MRFLDFSTPWLIEPVAADRYLRVYADILARRDAGAELNTDELAARGVELGKGNKAMSQGNVAVLSIDGPMVKHADLMDAVSGLTSYEGIKSQLMQLEADPDISAIALDINSPGGQMAGCFGLADYIRNGVSKPIVAHSDGSMCSAAYALACACDEVVLSKSAMAGSIGAIFGLIDDTKQQAMMGLKEIKFISSVSPNKNPDPSTDAGAAQYQQLVDDAGSEFVALVSKMRNVPAATVKSDYGKGGVMMGARAVKAGLADKIDTLDGVVKNLAAGKPPARLKQLAANTAEGDKMNLKERIAALFAEEDAQAPETPATQAAVAVPATQLQSGQVLFDGLTQEQVRTQLAELNTLKTAQAQAEANTKAAALEAFKAKHADKIPPAALKAAAALYADPSATPAMLQHIESMTAAMAETTPGAGPAKPEAKAGERPNEDAEKAKANLEDYHKSLAAMGKKGHVTLAQTEAGRAYMAANHIAIPTT